MEMYSVWCDGVLENEEVRRDMTVLDPEVGVTSAASFPILGVVSGHAKSIAINEDTRCCVRREKDMGIVYISTRNMEMTVAE